MEFARGRSGFVRPLVTPKSARDEIGGSDHLADGRTVLKVRVRALVWQTLALHLPGGMVANAG